jgi:hypothetical protein
MFPGIALKRSFAGWLAGAMLAATGCLLILPVESSENSSPGTGGDNRDGGPSTMMGVAHDAAADATSCVVNADCTAKLGVPGFCRTDRTCTALGNTDCPIVYGNSQDPNAVLIGAYALIIQPDDLAPQSATSGSTTVRDYELAINELNAPLGGLPDRGGTIHPLVVVICNRDAPPNATNYFTRTVDHLAGELQIPAIVGDLAPDHLATAFNRGKDQHVFWISPGPQTQELTTLLMNNNDAAGLLWNMVGSPRAVAPIYPVLLSRIARHLQIVSRPLNVAVVRTTSPAEATLPLLVDLYNDVIPKLGAFNVKDYVLDSTNAPLDVATALMNVGPDVVVSMAGTQFTDYTPNYPATDGVVGELESLLLTDGGIGKPRPYYVFNPINFGARDLLTAMVQRLDPTQPNAFQRFVGVNVARTDDRTLYGFYMNRLKDFFPAAEEETESWYDSIYYLAYSMYSAGVYQTGNGVVPQPLDGRSIGAGMLSLLAGPMFNVEADSVNAVFAALRNQQPSSIELIGTAGAPSFNTSTGARNANGALFCFDHETINIQAQVYVPDDGGWTGTFCYAGFE